MEDLSFQNVKELVETLPEKVKVRGTFQRKMGTRNKQKPRQRRNEHLRSRMATDELIFTAIGLGKKQQH